MAWGNSSPTKINSIAAYYILKARIVTLMLIQIGTIIFVVMFLGNCYAGTGDDNYHYEFDSAQYGQLNPDNLIKDGHNVADGENEDYPFHKFVTLGLIRFYQKFISPVKGQTCPMYPTCSHYAYLSFKNYNPLKAFMMTADRLHRCNHDLENYSFIKKDEGSGYYDPPDSSYVYEVMQSDHIKKEFNDIELSNASQNAGMDDENFGEDYRLFLYAENLRANNDYYRAITEYRRLLSYYPDSPYRINSLKGLLYCYYETGEYFPAIHLGQDILSTVTNNEEDSAELNYLIGASYYKLGNFRLAREYLSRASNMQSALESDFQQKSLLLQGVTYAKESNWKEAERLFASVKDTSQFTKEAKYNLEIARKGANLNLKNPAVAGTLAIIPGLGYLYDGYTQTAIASFLVNGLFMWGTIEAFQNDNQGLGVVLGLFSFGFYTGNIYGSITSAERKNIKNKEDLIVQFKLAFP